MDCEPCYLCGLTSETVAGGYDLWRVALCWDCYDAEVENGQDAPTDSDPLSVE